MSRLSALKSTTRVPRGRPRVRDVIELLKPVTWFPPMWAFMCGVVSSGVSISERWPFMVAGMILAGPLVCGMSQAVNDWYDRHVDAINEPARPIPSGRIPGRWGLWIAIIGSIASLIVAGVIGPWVLAATILGVILAWAYSMPPVRLKMSGWWGPLAVAFCYEGLTWFTGAAVMSGGLPRSEILWLVLLYSLGAHGIMTLNDFKAVEGDRQMGIASLPVTLGVNRAAKLACAIMALPQVIVTILLLSWGLQWSALAITALLIGQGFAMTRMVSDPEKYAPWYNATGVAMYVSGMLIAAIGVGRL
jgi:chlorophyll/bacteriochlorophyll a synthase